MEGSIIRKELEYSGSGDGLVPVSDVPLGVSAKLHVWGRNDMDISQGMGIYWFIADPDGMIPEEYEDWGGTIGAHQTHEFISSGQFTLDKLGKYTMWIDLYMGSEANPERVDLFIGELCTVTHGWVNVDMVSIPVTVRPEVVGWVLVDTKSMGVTVRPEVVGWALLDVKIIALSVGVPEPPPSPPPEEEEFPWLPVVLIGGGLALAASALIPSKTKT